ncbi:MAG: hypothetical protein CL402_04090 [Acidiferrobacteraceae bacterium]|nr:hypothetical protein [Acidiferrobacteraceae bacterium]|tara:strand:+ start:21510 stop:22406 length:897 start_codon:yes stop_codon:yes gene_type:complete
MNYTELHLHLDGSMRDQTLIDLANDVGIALPNDIRFHSGLGLEEALMKFKATLSCLQHKDHLKRVASEICEDASLYGVSVLEIRFAPQLHPIGSPEEIVDAVLDGINGRAGLILCGLYGESPSILNSHVEIAKNRTGVVAIDLAGAPQSSHRWNIEDYAEPYQTAFKLDIGRTVHAGEARRPPSEIKKAINLLHAQRIGHGTSLLEDFTVLDLVVNKQVVIEACPTSNMHTGSIRSVNEHPLPKWLELGVKTCINCDNWLLSDVNPAKEYQRVLSIPGMSKELVDQCLKTGRESSFAR